MKLTKLKANKNRLIALFLSAVMFVGIIAAMPFTAAASAPSTEPFPYAVFASSSQPGAIKSNFTSFNEGNMGNGHVTIATNGTFENAGTPNDSYTVIENANQPMIQIGGRIIATQFAGNNVQRHAGNFSLSHANSSVIADPIMAGGNFEYDGNMNDTPWGQSRFNSIMAGGDIYLKDVRCDRSSDLVVVYSEHGDIIIDNGGFRGERVWLVNVLLYAPNGNIVINGSEIIFSGVAIAQTVTFNKTDYLYPTIRNLNIHQNQDDHVAHFVGVVSEPAVGCSGGRIAPPSSANHVNFINGNAPDSSSRASLDFNVLDLIAGTCVRANQVYGFEAVTWGANTENRHVTFVVNGVESPRFHGSSSNDPAMIWATMSHGNPPNNGGRTEQNTLTYMNRYSGNPQVANNPTAIRPFVADANPAQFNVRIRARDNHSSLVTSVALLGANEQVLGIMTYSTRDANGVWSDFIPANCVCKPTNCLFGGTIAPPVANGRPNFMNGNALSSTRSDLEFDVLDLIAGTAIRANQIYGIMAVTWGANTENRQATFEVNGGSSWVASPRFHSSGNYDAARIWSTMACGNTPNNVGRTEEQRLTYMNQYGGNPQTANNPATLRPFVSGENPDRFDVRLRTNNEHAAMVTEIVLLDSAGNPLGGAGFSADNNAWLPLLSFIGTCGDCLRCEKSVDIASGLVYTWGNGGVKILGFDGDNPPQDLWIPDRINNQAVVEIGAFAFENLENLRSVRIPGRVSYIGWGAFAGSSVESVTFAEPRLYADEEHPGMTIDMLAFADTANLVSIDFPDHVRVLEMSSFQDSGLTSVTFGAGISSIPDSAFANTALTSVTIPGTVRIIGNGAFRNIPTLTSVSFALPSSLTRIDANAFTETGVSRANVAIPAGVNVHETAFGTGFEPRLYTNATIEHNFNGSSVIVMMDRSVQGVNKIHCPSFFGDFPIMEIIDLTWLDSDESIERALQNIDRFRQILRIVLPYDCKENVLEIIGVLEAVDGVWSAEPDFYVRPSSVIPNNFEEFYFNLDVDEFDYVEYYDNFEWDNLDIIGVHALRNFFEEQGVILSDVYVGVLDSGIANHPDLRIWESPTSDLTGHGTMTAGVIQSVANNVVLAPLRITEIGEIIPADVSAAVIRADAQGIPILNFSNGWSLNAVENFEPQNINNFRVAIENYSGLFIAAAGGIYERPDYLASLGLSNVIVVGASDHNDEVANRLAEPMWVQSNYCGETVHLFAPGLDIRAACMCRADCTRCDGSGTLPPCGNCGSCNRGISCTNQWCDCTHIECLRLSPIRCGVCANCNVDGECANSRFYCLHQNTSAAAPHVAGVAALLYGWYYAVSGEAPCRDLVRTAIIRGVDSGDNLNTPGALNGKAITNGRLNALGAFQALYDALQCNDCSGFPCTCVFCENCSNRAEKCVCTLSECGDWYYFIRRNTVTVIEYRGNSSSVEIPVELGGEVVMWVGAEAFKENAEITSIVIPNTVRRIDARAFSYCTQLATVTFRGVIRPIFGIDVFQENATPMTLIVPFGTTANYEQSLVEAGLRWKISSWTILIVENCLECDETRNVCECVGLCFNEDEGTGCRRLNCECCDYCKRPGCNGKNYCIGDVIGEGKPSVQGALQILRFLVGLTNVFDGNHALNTTVCPIFALYAARIRDDGELGRDPTVQDALQILRRLVGLSNDIDNRRNLV